MKVAIDVSSAAKADPTGIGRYIVELVRNLAPLLAPAGDRLRLMAAWKRRRDREHLAPLAALPGVEGPALLLRWLPGLLMGGADLLHGTGLSLPAAVRAPAAVTIHDINTIDDPTLARDRTVARRAAKTAKVLRRADLVIVVAAFVRDRILHHFPEFPADRIRVVHHGVDHAGLSPERGPGDAAVLARHGLGDGRPYVLFVGRVEHRKNPDGLVRGFARAAAAKEARLVFAGMKGRSSVEDAIRETGIGERARFLGRVEDADLGPLYRGAACFALPSRYEGFGIPLAEAFACGAPALASNATALPEVAGDAAELCAIEPEAIAAGLDRVLGDAERARALRERGLARAREFTWRRCAERTLEAYRDLLRLGKR
ncbi:MAG TPA: glycosyltransferase family 1 protein [Planctomycetota bacterium]|nr:glycosyltransferase family 1 protein [Planctomycetota bacterium]